ncbi:hypothetical protein BC829DRAFT_277488 [Chytridium lagenaria]|nr:hypothetical protein BC829DRAFT_277488 [Chytridium lagenaria]
MAPPSYERLLRASLNITKAPSLYHCPSRFVSKKTTVLNRLTIPTLAGRAGPRPPELALHQPQSDHPFPFEALIQDIKSIRFSPEEDQILMQAVLTLGEDFGRIREHHLPHRSTSAISGRWMRLNPKYRRGKWSDEEMKKFKRLVERYGMKWDLISKEHMPWRSPLQMSSKYRSSFAGRAGEDVVKGTEKKSKDEPKGVETLDGGRGGDSETEC